MVMVLDQWLYDDFRQGIEDYLDDTDDDDDDDNDVRVGRPNPIRHNSGSNDRDRTAPSCLRGTSDPPAVTQHFISTHWADVKL